MESPINFLNSFRNTYTLDQINALTDPEFHRIFDNVIELRPQAAIFCSAIRPFQSHEVLIRAFINYLECLPLEEKIKVLKRHPDLAGKLANEPEDTELTSDSRFEQSAVGLNAVNVSQKKELSELNEAYKGIFGFPFIICVREAKKLEVILDAMKERIHNNVETEIQIGMDEVKKICRLRILQLIPEE